MSYLVAIPCVAIVCLVVDSLELRRSSFALFAILLTTVFAVFRWFTPGVDVIIASCLTMAMANFCAWFINAYATEDEAHDSDLESAQGRVRRFCSRLTHDYAVSPRDSLFAINLIKSGGWEVLRDKLAAMTPVERQGFFANLNYSSVSERALQEIINANPKDADCHILMGHVKLCLAKRQGLQPGSVLDESVAQTMAQAFKHFNSALRLKPDEPEAHCGLLMAKGFTGLSTRHMFNSLSLLLQHDPHHLHGVIASARFLVLSPSLASEFVSVVETAVDGRCDATVAIAKIITHIECMGFTDIGSDIGTARAQIVADVYQQLRSYQKENHKLGSWQKGIANNVIAYILQLLGDKEQLNQYLQKIEGSVSPYPWQSNTVTEATATSVAQSGSK